MVMEYEMVICDGVIEPLKLTNTAPATAAMMAESTYAKVL